MTEPLPDEQEAIKSSAVPNPAIEQQIRLEEARRASLEAERLNAAQAEKHRRAEARRERFGSLSTKTWIIVIAVIAIVAISIPAFIIPALSPKRETTYLVESDLERIVDVSNLSTIDYTYSGIVEKKGWFDWTDYRIKYTARIRASFDMTKIRFAIDNNSKVITASLPEPIIEEPVIENGSLSFLPEGKEGDMVENLILCEEDAASEVANEGQIEELAYENLRTTIEALTFPLIGEDYTLAWEYQSETPEGVSSNEA